MGSAQISRTASVASNLALCLFALSICFALAGCEESAKTAQVIEQRSSEAQQSLADAEKQTPQATTYDPLTVTDKIWGGNAALRMQRGMPLPPRFEATRGITLVSSEPMSLSDIANAISEQTGIPVRLSALTIAGKSVAPSSTFSPSSPSSPSSPVPASLPLAASADQMPISYEGPLSGLLDRMSAYFGVNWHFDGSSIAIARFETRIFSVEALPGTQEINEGMQDDVSSSSGSSGSGGSSGSSSSSGSGGSSSGSSTGSENTLTQNSKTKMELKYWDELSAVLTSIVGSEGHVVVSPTIGTVTVTATPEIMTTVSDYLAKENKELSHQIAINVQIYSVDLGQSEDFNITFTGFLKRLASLNYTSASAPGILNTNLTAASLGSLSIAILNSPSNTTTHAGDIFQALSSIGDTSEVAQFPMTTLNNRPVSRRVGTDTSYIQSVTQNTTTAQSTTTLLTPIIATIHDGFSLQLTPRLLDDGRILLQYSLSLIGVDTLGATTFSGLPLDLPVTDNRIFVQQSMLRSGQTLIIGGVDQEKLAQNKQGVGSPDNFLLGGGVSTNNSHLMLFMAITPQVMDLTDQERS